MRRTGIAALSATLMLAWIGSLSACRSTTEDSDTAATRVAPNDSSPSLPPSKPVETVGNYPRVDPNQDHKLTLYDRSLQSYRNFSGRPDDQAKFGEIPIVGFIKESKAKDGRLVEGLTQRPFLVEKHLLKGTPFEPIRLPKQAFLDKLISYQKTYWRHGPETSWKGAKEEVALGEDSRRVYGTLGTFPFGHSEYGGVSDVYPLHQCLSIFRPAPWGPLQIHYFCMVPAVYRVCYRYLVPGKIYAGLISKQIKRQPAVYDAENHRISREVVLATCLANRGQRDDPLWTQLLADLKFPRELGFRTGPELFDFIEPNDRLKKQMADWVAASMIIMTETEHKSTEFYLNRLAENFRQFYRDQEFVVDGQRINLFNYIMFAPVLKFNTTDQLAILNSLYDRMNQNGADGKAYWPGSDASCPVRNYADAGRDADEITIRQSCDPAEFWIKGIVGSSGR